MKLSKPKYIFVTGGVASSLGKGIISASIARLLQARGYSARPDGSLKYMRNKTNRRICL